MERCWYKEFTMSDIKSASPEEMKFISAETLRRLWCTNYGYLNSDSGQAYAKKLKTIAKKLRAWQDGQTPETIMKWLIWVLENKKKLNEILLPRFQFKEK